MSLIIYILFICLFAYTAILLWLAAGFLKSEVFASSDTNPDMPLTLIVCARNEERHISLCLNTILKQDYDLNLIQILFVNDASQDLTLQIAEGILKKSGVDYSIISNATQKGKKQSIANAMQHAKHNLIVTRDADTFTRSDKWLKSISAFYQKELPDMIIAPVALSDHYTLLWALQAIENNILLLAAAGSAFYKKPFLCSGANLVFTKNAFIQTGAYASHLTIASGDDVLFLEDLKRIEGAKISYLKSKEAIVYTFPCYSLTALIKQKTRWAAKFKTNRNRLNLLLALLSALTNLGWIICLMYGFLQPINNSLTLLFIVSKLLIDFLLLFLTSGFIKNRYLLWFSLPVGCIYPVYACIIATTSLFTKPKWK